ncbi:hypothetical protein AX760_15205 [Pararhizobium antarcticum]|uniref:Uncharacterized protein n=1 Tax=Pararhizobium antarcticum TaxID=1798805 RepID=A0A657LUY2_9HYPH|nr:hypothetical protein AX760_15205 [Pararhizobium antarcticum]
MSRKSCPSPQRLRIGRALIASGTRVLCFAPFAHHAPEVSVGSIPTSRAVRRGNGPPDRFLIRLTEPAAGFAPWAARRPSLSKPGKD